MLGKTDAGDVYQAAKELWKRVTGGPLLPVLRPRAYTHTRKDPYSERQERSLHFQVFMHPLQNFRGEQQRARLRTEPNSQCISFSFCENNP